MLKWIHIKNIIELLFFLFQLKYKRRVYKMLQVINLCLANISMLDKLYLYFNFDHWKLKQKKLVKMYNLKFKCDSHIINCKKLWNFNRTWFSLKPVLISCQLQMDEKQLKSINSKANHKKFVDHVVNGNVEKVNKMCTKGLDPNFHCADSGGEH